MKILIAAGLVIASTVALSACGKNDDTANTPDTMPGSSATAYTPAAPVTPITPMPSTSTVAPAYPPPATTAGMNNGYPPTARSIH